jgi:hypothetical protein
MELEPMRCIICDQERPESEEHIFPAGDWGLSCDTPRLQRLQLEAWGES